MAAAAASSARDIPTRTAKAINSSVDHVASSHIYITSCQLTPGSETYVVDLPYTRGLFWTDFKFNWSADREQQFTVTFKSGDVILSSHTNHTQNTWHHLTWPIPSIESSIPLSVYITVPSSIPTLNNFALKVVGFENILPLEHIYILIDPNGECEISAVRYSSYREIKYYSLVDSGYTLEDSDQPINTCSYYLHRYENPHLYDSDSDSYNSW
jgi:hypothetical protein